MKQQRTQKKRKNGEEMLKINITYYVTKNSFASLRTCRVGTDLLRQTCHRQRCLEMADEGDKKKADELAIKCFDMVDDDWEADWL